jgi:hypothetical protein
LRLIKKVYLVKRLLQYACNRTIYKKKTTPKRSKLKN